MATIKVPNAKRLYISALIIFLGGLLWRGCFQSFNSLSELGFPLDNSAIIIDNFRVNLKGAEIYVKASLTQEQTNILHKSFIAEPSTEQVSGNGKVFPTTPKDIPPMPENNQWQPQLVKKYWSGSFKKADEIGNNFHCRYIFDVKSPNKIVLYFYGITFDD